MAETFELENLIERPIYLDQLISYKDERLIKIITGVRRCGKSTLVFTYTRTGLLKTEYLRIK